MKSHFPNVLFSKSSAVARGCLHGFAFCFRVRLRKVGYDYHARMHEIYWQIPFNKIFNYFLLIPNSIKTAITTLVSIVILITITIVIVIPSTVTIVIIIRFNKNYNNNSNNKIIVVAITNCIYNFVKDTILITTAITIIIIIVLLIVIKTTNTVAIDKNNYNNGNHCNYNSFYIDNYNYNCNYSSYHNYNSNYSYN